MKPVLVGIDNPHSSDDRHALYPGPPGCTGWRIWQMIRLMRPDVTASQYALAFSRCNISSSPTFVKGETVVLLGEDVRKRVEELYGEIPRQLIHPTVRRGVTFRQVPHPSGMNRFYNDPTQRDLVALLLAELYDTYQRDA